MLGTRHEDYSKLEGRLPFKLVIDRKVTPLTYSPEANWHDNLEIQLCTDGEGYVTLDDKNISFEKNDIIAVNSNVIHHTNSKNSITYTCIIFDTEFCKSVDIDPSTINFNEKIDNEKIRALFSELCLWDSKKDDGLRLAMMNIIALKMLIELRQNHTVSESKIKAQSKSFSAVKETIKFIRANYERKITLDEISKAVLMDKYTLSREFKRITNQTIVEYINGYRCKKASVLISEGYSVSDAAVKCGFSNMSFFTRTFREYVGCLPSKFSKNR